MLGEVAAEYARRNGPPLKVLIYGGTAVTLRHNFRTATHDIDYALWEPSPLFEDCVAAVGEKYRLFPRWMHSLEQFTSAPHFRENFAVMPMRSAWTQRLAIFLFWCKTPTGSLPTSSVGFVVTGKMTAGTL